MPDDWNMGQEADGDGAMGLQSDDPPAGKKPRQQAPETMSQSLVVLPKGPGKRQQRTSSGCEVKLS